MAQPFKPLDGFDRLLVSPAVAPVRDNADGIWLEIMCAVDPVTGPGYCAGFSKWIQACFLHE